MPVPIHPDYNFKVNHKKKDNHYSMKAAASYGNMYGIGYMISGDRMMIVKMIEHEWSNYDTYSDAIIESLVI